LKCTVYSSLYSSYTLKDIGLFSKQHTSELFLQNGSLNLTRCAIFWLCKHIFFFPKCIGFLLHFKKEEWKACKWITSIGWTGHLRGVWGRIHRNDLQSEVNRLAQITKADQCSPSLQQEMCWEAGEWFLQALPWVLRLPWPHSLLLS
jgi:hypothetical protein